MLKGDFNTKNSSILRYQIISTIRLKNQFGWEEEIPEIGKRGVIFRDRSFALFVLSCQSKVFQAMFKCKSTVESESGEVEIEDFKAKTVAKMVYFVYHDNLMNKENVDSDFLLLAEKYNVRGLISFLDENLSLESALDVLVSSHLTNQKRLFDAAAQFTIENKGLLVKTEKWKELLETNPKLASKIMITMLQ